MSQKKSVKVEANNLTDYLGVPKYRYGEVEDNDQIGIVTGLAWSDVGGELLTIEAAMMPGKGRMTVTGNLRNSTCGHQLAAANAGCSRDRRSSCRPWSCPRSGDRSIAAMEPAAPLSRHHPHDARGSGSGLGAAPGSECALQRQPSVPSEHARPVLGQRTIVCIS